MRFLPIHIKHLSFDRFFVAANVGVVRIHVFPALYGKTDTKETVEFSRDHCGEGTNAAVGTRRNGTAVKCAPLDPAVLNIRRSYNG